MLLDVAEEGDVVFVRSDFELFSDVLQKVYVTDLYDDIGKDILCRLLDRRVVITGHRDERVVHVLELREELLPCFEALCAGEDAAGKVMCGVVHAIQERNLLLVAFHLHMFAIGHQRAAEAFPVAVVVSDLIVVWEHCEFFHYFPVRSTNAHMSSVRKCANACPFEMQTEKGFRIFATVIYIEACIAILAMQSVYSSSFTLFPDMIGSTGRTMWATAL